MLLVVVVAVVKGGGQYGDGLVGTVIIVVGAS